MNLVKHRDWLKSRGYREHLTKDNEIATKTHFQLKINSNEQNGEPLFINVEAWNFKNPDIPGSTRYEVEAQLNGSITMNITLFTLFDHDLTTRLEGIEHYIKRLAEMHKSVRL